MRRCRHAILPVLTLLLCVATCAMWAAGRRAARMASWSRPGHEWQAATSRGSAWVYWASFPAAASNQSPPGLQTRSYPPVDDPRAWGYGPRDLPFALDVVGLAVGHGPYAGSPARTASLLIAPCWMPFALTLLAAMWAGHRWRRRRSRRGEGRCASCGYDLTGNVSGTCPECGVAAKEAT